MKDQWLNDIKQRMSDFELDEPDGLWDSIEARRPVVPSKSVRFVMPRRCFRPIAVAAALLVLFGLGFSWLARENDMRVPEMREDYASAVVVPDVEPVKQTESGIPHKIDIQDKSKVTKTGYISENAESESSVDVVTDNINENDDKQNCEQTESINTENNDVETNGKDVKKQSTLQTDKYTSPLYASRELSHLKKSTSRRVRLGLSTSGATSMSASHVSPANMTDVSLGPDCSSWKDSPLLVMLLFNKGNETSVSVKHHTPLTFGLTVEYGLTPSLSVESGITYSRLTSDVREGGDKYYYTGEQKLHYIGIPLNLKYTVLSWKALDLYASAGVRVQKCVSGEVDKRYVIEDMMKSTETERLHVKPLQWSLSGAVGVQWNISRLLGLYAEPGVGYWFDDGSSLQTIYKEKPLNFNLNIGLRLNVGR